MPAITKPNLHFDATTYTGTGSALSVTNGGFQPDWVWMKSRTSGGSPYTNHTVIDSVRGAGTYGYKNLNPNLTDAEYDPTSGNAAVTALNSNGFTLGGNANVNTNTMTAVAWQWKAGGAAVTNTSGTISSQVSANPTAGFSVVTYTGTGANATVGHGLGVAPSMIIGKRRNGIADWMVGHSGVNGGTTPFNYFLVLNSTAAQSADSTAWNNTAPTSTVFSLGSGGNVNSNTATNVMYCFAAVAGYSAFGSYTGNGATDGPFIYTGFRPRWIMVKRTDTGGADFDWFLWDTARDTFNQASANLTADQSVVEGVTAYPLDINSNGFKLRNTATAYNASGGTYIYACFAENPFKYANAR